eukprot:COSAG04_NODE_1_length_58448_cov_23.476478_20_plen_96_part_00
MGRCSCSYSAACRSSRSRGASGYIIFDDNRLGDGRGGFVFCFLWGVLSSLAATAWICFWGWAPWYPALASAAALVTVLFEAIKEAAVLMKGERRG